MAMTAWSANVLSSSIWRSEKRLGEEADEDAAETWPFAGSEDPEAARKPSAP